ncbi:MAG: BamA/TamA family outer membrane protein [Proteobacteria bacterium]|nr:BamA/TamA family outer membrane protein [Pseudomonadota bacterium]
MPRHPTEPGESTSWVGTAQATQSSQPTASAATEDGSGSKEPADSEFDSAPAPDEASGVLVPRDRGGQGWRVIPRGLMYPLRGIWYVLWGVPRLGMWAYDRFQLEDRFKQIFFNQTETAGLFPVVFYETRYGWNLGGRLILRDLFAEDMRFRARASYGGRFSQNYGAKFSSGKLFGDTLEIEILSDFEIFPKSRFAGIGNADLDDVQPDMALIDPLQDDTAIATRYRHDDFKIEFATLAHLTDRLSVRVAGRYKKRTFDPDADERDDEEIVDVYDTDRLVGYDTGLSNLYGELELSYDSRRTTRFYLSPAAPSTGWKFSGFAGYQSGFDDDPSSHLRWGADLQRYFDLYGGDRILILRAYVEGVTGELDEIPFVDLPSLGGPLLLRGYDRDRFRDRALTLATVEYNYPIERNIIGYVFVDTGRVWRTLGDFEFDDFRVGFGGGMQVHSVNGFVARVFIASSIDGGFVANLSFDPVFDSRAREETR